MRCVCRVGEFCGLRARLVHARAGVAGSESVGRVCATRGARARLEGGGGAKKGGRASPRSNPFGERLRGCGACAGAGRRVAGAGYAVARAGAVIISGRKTKKKGFSPKKNTKKRPRRIRTRPRAFIYRRARVFCLPSAGAGAYIARVWSTAPQNPPRKPPQNLRRRRSLCRLPSVSAADRLAIAATAPRARRKPVGATATALDTVARALAATARRRAVSKSTWPSRQRNAASSISLPKMRGLNFPTFCEILSIPFKFYQLLLRFICRLNLRLFLCFERLPTPIFSGLAGVRMKEICVF